MRGTMTVIKSLLMPGARNNASNTRLNFKIEERIIEIMRPPRGRVMYNDWRHSRFTRQMGLPGHGKPQFSNRLRHHGNGADHGWRFLDTLETRILSSLTNLPDQLKFPSVRPCPHKSKSVSGRGSRHDARKGNYRL
jgi:hypothetical protein